MRLTWARVPVTSWNSDRVKPGHTAVTCTPSARTSPCSDSENFTRNDFEAPYSVCPGAAGTSAASDDTLITRPQCRATMPGSSRWVSSATAVTSTCRKSRCTPQSLAR